MWSKFKAENNISLQTQNAFHHETWQLGGDPKQSPEEMSVFAGFSLEFQK